jgi:uncharacterized membrane protein SpoIIM required for sporulation/ABC-type transport system involved in multi-copper enzyme maturation permease subunit
VISARQASMVWVITRREIRDTVRDWRLVVPIVLLTLVFPVVLNFAASYTLRFVQQYNAAAVGEQAVPFLLLVVGFFPISFSLVIALETFVGERERKSLEPLLATPLSNTQLYLGKTLAALIPPVLAAFLGISIYLVSLFVNIDYRPPAVLVLQVLLLTTVESMLMVSAAVIVSSQTTSVRAANLLASFIILPMAFLVQGEAIIMFWSRFDLLWFVLMGLLVSNVILVRMGIRIFNREELLGREIDNLNIRRGWRIFKACLVGPPEGSTASASISRRARLARVYLTDVPILLRVNGPQVVVVLVTLAAAVILGLALARVFSFPPGLIQLEGIDRAAFEGFQGSQFLPSLSVWGILSHNVKSLLAAALLGILSFGSITLVMLMAPVTIIAFAAAQIAAAGYNPLMFVGAFVLPHGIVELPAAILATAAALRLGMSIIAPPSGVSVSRHWLQSLAYFIKLFLLVVVPLLGVAAYIEVHITPEVVLAFYGG